LPSQDDDGKTFEIMTPTLPLGTSGSVAPLFVETLYRLLMESI